MFQQRIGHVANIDTALQKSSAALSVRCPRTMMHVIIISVKAVALQILLYRGIPRQDKRDQAVEDRTSAGTVHRRKIPAKSRGMRSGKLEKLSVTGFKDMAVIRARAINSTSEVMPMPGMRAERLVASIHLANSVATLKTIAIIISTMSSQWNQHSAAPGPALLKTRYLLLPSPLKANILH